MKLNRKQRRHLTSLQRKGVKIKMARTEEELQKDYTALAAQAGELSYMLAAVHQRMSAINTENQTRLTQTPKEDVNANPTKAPKVDSSSSDAA